MREQSINYIYAKLHFRWKPHSEISSEAIQRMRENFPKPKNLPFVAWFMGEVRYHEDVDAVNWSIDKLIAYLRDTRSGIESFGRLKIWVDWFHYLLPDLILRAEKEEDSNLYEDILEYCLILYRHELSEEYLGFRGDIFATLLTIIMQERFWPDENEDFAAPYWLEPIEVLHTETNGAALEYRMLFCLKFLTIEDMVEWIESIAAIESKKWQEKFSTWLKDLEKFENIWNIPSENVALFHQEIAKYPQFQT